MRLFIFVFIAGTISVNGQYTKEFKRIFFDADYLYETQFYEEAFNRYKNLLTLDPGNSNILFLCGACCLSIPGSEDLAITYLKEAVAGVSRDYKEHSHKEASAPIFAYFMLGQSYHLNYEFDKAIENYQKYLELGASQDPLQLEFTTLQINACKRGAALALNRPSFEFYSVLDHFDDDLPSCNNPVISGDGNILIFLVDYPADKKIMMTTRKDSVWSRPRVINSEIGMVGETYPVSLSYDGKDLYMVHQFYSHSDIFVSKFEGGRWSEAKSLGHNINKRTSENHASISKDGKTLYFTSDVRGGMGSFDIYVSKLGEKGEWGLPSNLGPVINTPYEEHTPFISSNDSILFFSSQGHATIGGSDVFYSELKSDGSWGEPVSLGYPVNTTGEDLFFNPGWDELDAYYAVRKADDPTSNAINMVLELEPEEQQAVTAQEAGKDVEVEEVEDVEEVEEVDHVEAVEAVSVPQLSDIPVVPAAEPEPETLIAEEEQIATITEVIEPDETDRIEEVLNRNRQAEIRAPEPVPVEAGRRTSELNTSIPFEHNEYELSMAAMLEVEKIAELLVLNPDSRIELTGHADATGSAEYNMVLSMQRADQIADYLEMRGIMRNRMSIDGKGESAPIARNSYPDGEDAPLGRYLNRQVYVKIKGENLLPAGLAGLYVPSSLKPGLISVEGSNHSPVYWFTIQLLASYHKSDLSHFQNFTDIREYNCTDKLYRYTQGMYRSFQEARDQLKRVHKMGFEDAYIQTLDWYERVCE